MLNDLTSKYKIVILHNPTVTTTLGIEHSALLKDYVRIAVMNSLVW